MAAAADWGKELASVEEFVARLTGNRERILRYAWIPQLLAGLLLLALSHYMGHTHFHLIRERLQAAEFPKLLLRIIFDNRLYAHRRISSQRSLHPFSRLAGNLDRRE